MYPSRLNSRLAPPQPWLHTHTFNFQGWQRRRLRLTDESVLPFISRLAISIHGCAMLDKARLGRHPLLPVRFGGPDSDGAQVSQPPQGREQTQTRPEVMSTNAISCPCWTICRRRDESERACGRGYGRPDPELQVCILSCAIWGARVCRAARPGKKTLLYADTVAYAWSTLKWHDVGIIRGHCSFTPRPVSQHSRVHR